MSAIREQMLNRIRATGRSEETFKTYWYWCEKFIRFVKDKTGEWKHPKDCGRDEVECWLSHLANGKEWVSKNTQNLALQSVCYLYREVIKQPLENVNALRAKRPENEREVVDQSELIKLFNALRGVELLAAQMMYGCSGLRIGDVVKIRIKDVSFERKQIHIHSGKGDKSRYVAFPECLHESVRKQIESMRVIHADDVRQCLNGVSLPDGFGRKCKSACLDFGWWYLFASDNYSRCPRSGILYRHHRDKSHIGRLIKDGVKRAGIDKRITSHCLRHSAATHANELGVDIRTLQVLMGHSDIRTTERYIHANKNKATASTNPLESLVSQRPVREASPMEDMLRNPPPAAFKPRLYKGA
jgi:integron integrase